jgi:hypothetical protein
MQIAGIDSNTTFDDILLSGTTAINSLRENFIEAYKNVTDNFGEMREVQIQSECYNKVNAKLPCVVVELFGLPNLKGGSVMTDRIKTINSLINTSHAEMTAIVTESYAFASDQLNSAAQLICQQYTKDLNAIEPIYCNALGNHFKEGATKSHSTLFSDQIREQHEHFKELTSRTSSRIILRMEEQERFYTDKASRGHENLNQRVGSLDRNLINTRAALEALTTINEEKEAIIEKTNATLMEKDKEIIDYKTEISRLRALVSVHVTTINHLSGKSPDNSGSKQGLNSRRSSGGGAGAGSRA